MRRWIAAVALAAACGTSSAPSPSPAPVQPKGPPDAAVAKVKGPIDKVPDEKIPKLDDEILEVAKLEATRSLADGKLAELFKNGKAATRWKAALALGRIGGPEAVKLLRGALGTDTPRAIRGAAIQGIAIAGATEAEDDLIKLLPGDATDPDWQPAVLLALGRCGGPKAATVIAGYLDAKGLGSIRVTAAMAMGELMYRKVKLPAAARAKLFAAAADQTPQVRYGVAFALSREPTEEQTAESLALSEKLAGDQDAETKALGLRTLAGREKSSSAPAMPALDDADWRVRVEAVRLLSREKGTPADRVALVAWIDKEWAAIAHDEAALAGPRVQPILEGLDRLQQFAKEPDVGALFAKLRAARPAGGKEAALRTAEAVHCKAVAAGVRAGQTTLTDVMSCGDKSNAWPAHLKMQLAADLIGEGLGGSVDDRVAALTTMWGDKDVRVRAAAAAAAVAIDDPRAGKIVREALASDDQVLLETAADAVASNAEKNAGKARPEYVDAIVEKAKDEKREPELRMTLFDALEATKTAAAVPILEAALTDPLAPVRDKAAGALEKITGRKYAAGKPRGAPPVPPVKLEDLPVVVRLNVTTTKGTFTLELNAFFATWNVATIVDLAKRGFFDHTIFHRVVPDFVVQGGDPTGTGMGGPGFTVPAEPTVARYLRGTVGIADSGLDTGGSQWFVMHAPAPHLEERYTIIGQVTAGFTVIDALIVGDEIQRVDVVE
jgi:cyclophilin family peptidyl-prolyl cis-trans isomerase/HEAT repeat protein